MERCVANGIAIISPYGAIWTDELFETPEAAAKYLDDFWKGIKFERKRFRLAQATTTIKVVTHPGEPHLFEMPD